MYDSKICNVIELEEVYDMYEYSFREKNMKDDYILMIMVEEQEGLL